MKARMLVPYAAVSTAFLCTTGMGQPCSTRTPCFSGFSASLLLVAVITFAVLVTLWIVRAAWLLHHVAETTTTLPRADWPLTLQAAAQVTGIERLECLAGPAMLAFCAGAIRPIVYVTRAAVESLRPDELTAVLIHERHHCRQRDPLRFALRRAAADVAFFLPIVDWWTRHAQQNAELAADRAAVHAAGSESLAGALFCLGSMATPEVAAAFAGAADLRVAQVLGEPLPCRRPTLSVWLTSAMGLLVGATTLLCLIEVILHPR